MSFEKCVTVIIITQIKTFALPRKALSCPSQCVSVHNRPAFWHHPWDLSFWEFHIKEITWYMYSFFTWYNVFETHPCAVCRDNSLLCIAKWYPMVWAVPQGIFHSLWMDIGVPWRGRYHRASSILCGWTFGLFPVSGLLWIRLLWALKYK